MNKVIFKVPIGALVTAKIGKYEKYMDEDDDIDPETGTFIRFVLEGGYRLDILDTDLIPKYVHEMHEYISSDFTERFLAELCRTLSNPHASELTVSVTLKYKDQYSWTSDTVKYKVKIEDDEVTVSLLY